MIVRWPYPGAYTYATAKNDWLIQIHSSTTTTTTSPWYDAGWTETTGGYISPPTGWWINDRIEQRIIQPSLTPDQARELFLHERRQEEEALERHRIRESRWRNANSRAEELLLSHLTPDQIAQYHRDKFFVVQGGKSKRQYRIHCGSVVANVHQLDETGEIKSRLCAHIINEAQVPICDHHLAQKLMIEHQEAEFLRIANDHGRR